jgi:hypothetical protein
MIHPRRKLRYALFTLNGHIGRTVTLESPHKVTILLTYYHLSRMNYIESQVRNFLKCTFVDKIVITNHNPDIKIEEKVNIKDDRLICLNQNVRRGNGYRWRVANTIDAEYFVVIDDDIQLFPEQLKKLFQYLLAEPMVPHGHSGQLHLPDDKFEFHERENMEVDYLCELYAVTRDHVKRYSEIEQIIFEEDKTLYEYVERFADHIVISQTAAQSPKIHEVTTLLRNDTFKTPGVATHKDAQFEEGVLQVCRAVKRIKLHSLVGSQSPAGSVE